MDVYNITNLATESVSADVTLPDNLKITKEEAQQKTDSELL